MQWFRNLKIGTRLAVGFGALIVFGLVGSGLAVQRIRAVASVAEQLGTEDAELLVLTQQWTKAIESNGARSWVVFYATDPVVLGRMKDEMKAVVDTQTGRLKRLNDLLAADPKALAMVADITRTRVEYQGMRAALLKRKDAGEDVIKEVNDKLYPLSQTYQASIEKMAEYQRQRSAGHRADAASAAQQGEVVLGVAGLLTLLAGWGSPSR